MHIRISCGGRVKWTYGASDSVGLAWSWEFSFLTSPQVMLVLLLPSNHTLKTLHLISSQFQSDNAGLSSLIRITGCEVSARHGATQTPRVVLKRARWLWIRTCHTITQTLKLRKTILGKKKALDSSSLMTLTDWSGSTFLWVWCSSSWLHIWMAWGAFKACMLRLHLRSIMSECLGCYPHLL